MAGCKKRPQWRRMQLYCAGLALASGLPAWAGDGEIQRVDVQGGSAQQQRNAAVGALVVVPRADLLRYGDSRLTDALRRVPGVTVVSNGADGSEIRMSGLGGGYSQLLLNGEPVPPGFQIDNLSPELIERVEISRGTNLSQSAQGVAGTVNIVLRRASRALKSELKLGLGSQKGAPLVDAQALWHDHSDELSWGVSLGWASSPDVWQTQLAQRSLGSTQQTTQAYNTVRQEFNRSQSLNLAPQATWTLGPEKTLTLDTLLHLGHTGSTIHDLRTSLAGTPPDTARDDLLIGADQQQLRSTLGWALKREGGEQTETKLGYTYGHKTSAGVMAGYGGSGLAIRDRSVDAGSENQGLSWTGRWHTPWRSDHAFSTGWDSEWQQRSEGRLQRDTALPGGLPLEPLDEHYDAQVGRLAGFAQDEWNLGPAWTLIGGLRWEGLQVHSQGNTFATVRSQASVLSPVLQALWQIPGGKDQLRAAIARTYKAPTPQELMPRRFYAFNNSATTPDTEGNPALRPELSWGLDLGWEHPLSESSQLSLNAYCKRIDQVVVDELYTQPDALGVAQWILHRVNHGQAWVQGAEVELRLALRELWPTAPAMSLRANLAVNNSRVQAVPGPNNRLAEQTPWTLNLGLDHKTEVAGLSWGASLNQQGGGWLRQSALRTTDKAAQRTLDLYTLWRQNPGTQWRLSLSNVLQGDIAEQRQVMDSSGGNTYLADERFRSALTARLAAEWQF